MTYSNDSKCCSKSWKLYLHCKDDKNLILNTDNFLLKTEKEIVLKLFCFIFKEKVFIVNAEKGYVKTLKKSLDAKLDVYGTKTNNWYQLRQSNHFPRIQKSNFSHELV